MPRPHPCLAPPPVPIAPHHLSTTPLLPAPIELASPASRSLRAAIRIPLGRHRADPALIAPHHDHRAPPPSYTCCASPSASRPPCADIRVTPPISLLALRRPRGPGWQESHRMHPPFAECAREALLLAASARNACFSRSRWQHPRPMHPFPGAIGRFGMHGARILPPRALFRVEEPEITHGAKMLPAPPGLSAAAACGPAERALHPAARAWPACRMRAPAISLVPAAACGLRHAAWPNGLCTLLSRFAVRDPPRGPHADASRYLRAAPIPPAARTHRVQETSGTTQATQCEHKNRIPKWGPY